MESLLNNSSRNYENLVEERNYLENIYHEQDILITDYSYSHFLRFDEKEKMQLLKAKDEEIEKTQSLIYKSQKYLHDLISNKYDSENEENNECGLILSTTIKQIQNQILKIIKKNMQLGKKEIDIKDMLLLINEINKMIEVLISTGKIIESEQEQAERSKKLDDLGLKSLSFLIQTQKPTTN